MRLTTLKACSLNESQAIREWAYYNNWSIYSGVEVQFRILWEEGSNAAVHSILSSEGLTDFNQRSTRVSRCVYSTREYWIPKGLYLHAPLRAAQPLRWDRMKTGHHFGCGFLIDTHEYSHVFPGRALVASPGFAEDLFSSSTALSERISRSISSSPSERTESEREDIAHFVCWRYHYELSACASVQLDLRKFQI